MQIIFKKTFFKDLQKLPDKVQSKVKHIVFIEIPAIKHLYDLVSIKMATNPIIDYVLETIVLVLSLRMTKLLFIEYFIERKSINIFHK